MISRKCGEVEKRRNDAGSIEASSKDGREDGCEDVRTDVRT